MSAETSAADATATTDSAPTMQSLQESVYSTDADYASGSPHLTHVHLRETVVGLIRTVVTEQLAQRGSCRVLEVGAGHGDFTDTAMALGAHVTVTEMSSPSRAALERRYRHNDDVVVLDDHDGEAAFRDGGPWDVVLCVAVLHHIPDYLGYVRRIVDDVSDGGTFLSYQDPLWYPRRSQFSMTVDRLSFIGWRLFQDDVLSGARSRMRRWGKRLDESRPQDMVEYHVVRDGCDEDAVASILHDRFASVEILPYWSTPGGGPQRVGERLGWTNTFGVVGRGATASP